ncbi:hypothetical protein VB774_16575 [Pseudanabaena galeata UHCC 0370]|uniref:Uncharacterized protein n=1 Tax=Pseudanabaena galeata UHCC 0370 TaxID=3110310 RepID=A0ABU5TMJ9_9CYAN|nr:hypothetical protein [Pseudanabaena galeata]MEA5479238.1 hypothetical protein [Pseudanabaena galeata UHCC 0370]
MSITTPIKAIAYSPQAITDQMNHKKKNLKALLSNAFKFFLGLGVKCCKTNNNAIAQSFKSLANNRQFTKESKQGDRLSN